MARVLPSARGETMPYVVTDLCTGCRYTECVSVCPVECFHIDDTMTYIDPQNCIDCGGCVPVCPVGAIKAAHKLAPDKVEWIEINRRRAAETPVVTSRLPPLPGADERKNAILLR
jgi:ferredoxin